MTDSEQDGASVVEVGELRKQFGSKTALDGVSFRVERGEVVGLLGPNGAGKTTAIHIMLGLTTATSGTVRLFGLDFERHRLEILQRCNFSSAYTNLPMNLRVWENMQVYSMLYEVPEWKRRAKELMELLELTHLRDRISGHLSSGETTRLNVCKALLNQPELLLLDEPTASLDPDMADKLRKILMQVRREKGITMLYTSHNMREVEEVCDRVLFLNRGRILASGTPRQVIERFRQRTLEEVFISVARDGELRPADGKGAP